MIYLKKGFMGVGVVITASVLFVAFSFANNSWGGFHWARTFNPFTLKLGDNVSSTWDPYLVQTSADWSLSSVLDTTIVTGSTKPWLCKPKLGRVEVCNAKYGVNGWLGIAQIWVSGSHITQGLTKLNDSYFNNPPYNTAAWRQLVLCQEVGHTFGLDHQDIVFDNPNLGSCMDYTNDPDGRINGQLSNLHPNTHDYEQLYLIYGHMDSSTTVRMTVSSSGNLQNDEGPHAKRSKWGKSLRKDHRGRDFLFEHDFGKGSKVYTFVIWAG